MNYTDINNIRDLQMYLQFSAVASNQVSLRRANITFFPPPLQKVKGLPGFPLEELIGSYTS